MVWLGILSLVWTNTVCNGEIFSMRTHTFCHSMLKALCYSGCSLHTLCNNSIFGIVEHCQSVKACSVYINTVCIGFSLPSGNSWYFNPKFPFLRIWLFSYHGIYELAMSSAVIHLQHLLTSVTLMNVCYISPKSYPWIGLMYCLKAAYYSRFQLGIHFYV